MFLYVCERSTSPMCGIVYLSVGVCVCVCTVMCNISIFCSDVRGVGVSVIHREQLHIGLREKQSHENV